MIVKTLSEHDLRQFTGSENWHRHGMQRRLIYTDGVQYLAEQGGAYWLIDAIASYVNSRQMGAAQLADGRLHTVQFWRLTVRDGRGLLECYADSGVPPCITQEIEYTDFPLPAVKLFMTFDGEHWCLMLPSEY
jgi:hypothetical protein